jgi:hypothetical protein
MGPRSLSRSVGSGVDCVACLEREKEIPNEEPQTMKSCGIVLTKRNGDKFVPVGMKDAPKVPQMTGVITNSSEELEKFFAACSGFKQWVVYRTCKGVPGFRRHGMGGRTDREQIDHHQLAIVVPARFKKARLRMPFH